MPINHRRPQARAQRWGRHTALWSCCNLTRILQADMPESCVLQGGLLTNANDHCFQTAAVPWANGVRNVRGVAHLRSGRLQGPRAESASAATPSSLSRAPGAISLCHTGFRPGW